jgi:hypothetical protein
VSYQPLNFGGVEGGSAQRPPEALRLNFFFSYLVEISFPIEFDVWGRLCTHFDFLMFGADYVHILGQIMYTFGLMH